jgi:uncharacterized protein YjbJ (UPF0337 family)
MSDTRGTTRDMGGRAQQTVGEAIGDAKMQAEGLYNQAAGQAQQQVARLSDVIREKPLAATLIAVGIGYLIGRFMANASGTHGRGTGRDK